MLNYTLPSYMCTWMYELFCSVFCIPVLGFKRWKWTYKAIVDNDILYCNFTFCIPYDVCHFDSITWPELMITSFFYPVLCASCIWNLISFYCLLLRQFPSTKQKEYKRKNRKYSEKEWKKHKRKCDFLNFFFHLSFFVCIIVIYKN